MDTFIALSSSVQIAFILFSFIIILLILGILFFAIKTKNIKSKYFSISSGKEERVSPHATCKYKSEIEILLLDQQEMLMKYFRIFEKEIISMCMKEVEEEIHKVYYTALDIFRETVNKEEGNFLELSKSFNNYMDCIRNFVIDQFRLWIRENHFAEKTEAEFDIYTMNKAENLENFIYSFGEKSKPEIHSEIFKDKIEDIFPQIKFATIMVLKKCRAISIQKQDEAQKLKETFNKKVQFTLGVELK